MASVSTVLYIKKVQECVDNYVSLAKSAERSIVTVHGC